MNETSTRTLPTNLEAEQALLGAILINNSALNFVVDIVRSDDFSLPVHGRIFDACVAFHSRLKEANPVTLKQHFENDKALEEAGGPQYLARLAGSAVTVLNAPQYAWAVADLSMRRRAHELFVDGAEQILADPYGAERDAIDHIEDIRQGLDELVGTISSSNEITNIGDAAQASIEATERAYKHEGSILGVTTGIQVLDEHLGGLQAPDLVLLAGRPGMGKTAMALTMAWAAAKTGKCVGVVSLEMSSAQLAERLLAMETGIAASRLHRGKVQNDDFVDLGEAKRRLEKMPIEIDARSGLTVEAIGGFGHRLKRRGLALLIVDHIGLIAPPRNLAREGRVNQMTYISGALKALSKKLDVPILALSQLNRAVQHRDNKRPMLDDLRESGSLEQDADIVMFIYRHAYYLWRERPEEHDDHYETWQANYQNQVGKAEVIVGKNRHGEAMTHDVRWVPAVMQFADREIES